MQYIKLKDGSYLEAPDDATDDQIRAKIEKIQGPKQEKKGSPKEKFENDWTKTLNFVGEPLKKVAEDYATGFKGLGLGALKGAANIAETALNLPHYAEEALFTGPARVFGKVDLGTSRLPEPQSKLGKFMQAVPEAATAMALPEASFGRLGQIAPKLAEALQSSKTARQALPQALFASSQAPEGEKAQSGLIAGGLTRALGTLPSTLEKAILPSTQLSPEELRRSLELARGTETILGSVVENPALKKHFENIISEIPLSGGQSAMQRTGKMIQRRGEDILSSLKGENEASNIGETLKNSLKKVEAETRTQKNALFNDLNKAADAKGITTQRTNLRNVAQEELDKIKSDPDLASFVDPGIRKILQKTVMQKPSSQSLKNTDLLRGKLGEKASDAYASGNSELGNLYKSLKDATLKDINEAIDTSKSADLHELRNKAMDYYKKEWVPFEDADIAKYTRRGADADMLMQSFLKTSRISDRVNLLEKLTSKLKPEEKKLLGHAYFSNAIKGDKFDPIKFKTLFESLGDRQKSALLDPENLEKIKDYSKLVEMNTKPITVMMNPETGAKLSAVPWITGIAGSLATGSPKGLAMGLSIPAYGFMGRKVLTSEPLREKIVQRMIKSKEMPSDKNQIAAFVNALMQLNRGNE